MIMITNKYKIFKMSTISQPKYATAKSDTSNPSHTESPSDQPTSKKNWITQNSCVIDSTTSLQHGDTVPSL
jgi:hypothetical protein